MKPGVRKPACKSFVLSFCGCLAKAIVFVLIFVEVIICCVVVVAKLAAAVAAVVELELSQTLEANGRAVV